ncbi:MAG: hypothetical protein SV686_06045 [Thermodesulfobacteriota bacterium]|nr:hypothetical protein [Thermodesulfobacteriota bacterium]
MADLPAICFPHVFVRQADISKIRPIFDKISICQPWFMEPTPSTVKGGAPPFVRYLYPSEGLKPKEDFRPLLSEYLLWIRQHRDRGYIDFLRAGQKKILSEDARWEISQMIRQAGEAPSSLKEMEIFKWHLLLHLAAERERNCLEAEEMLKKIKKGKPPLIDAIEEEGGVTDMLKGLPDSDIYPAVDEEYLHQQFDAWLGLFAAYLPEHGPLITFDRQVMDYTVGIFAPEAEIVESDGDSKLLATLVSYNVPFVLNHLPSKPPEHGPEYDLITRGLAGKTMILIEE